MSQPLMQLKNVGLCFRQKKSFKFFKNSNEFWALEDISFEVHAGEVIGLIGKNGGGKSTTLSIIAEIVAPDRGEYINNGATTALLDFNSGMIPYLSGRNNILIQSLYLGMEKREIEEKVEKVIELAGIGDAIDKPVTQYSSGMKARLGFAIAYFRSPDVLLIDEALGVGDHEFREISTKLMKEKIQSGKATIFVSHSQQDIRDLCTKCVLIKNGRSVLFDKTDVVLKEYLKK